MGGELGAVTRSGYEARTDRESVHRLLGAVVWPAEAYWRAIEMRPLRSCPDLVPPILEVGCGEGAVTEQLGVEIHHAVDLNPRAAAVAAARPNYGTVEVVDVHDLAGRGARYRTVLANSVLEHVSDLQPALDAIRSLLEPGGALVTTVPLQDMNRHLSLSGDGYVAWRQRRLVHCNLWSRAGWRDNLLAAGFEDVEFTGYLTGDECAYWDRMDAIGNVGVGPVRVAPLARRASRVLPSTVRSRLKEMIGARLSRRLNGDSHGEQCAALVVARVAA